MGTVLVNWGLGVTFLGTVILVGVAVKFNPLGAFRVNNEEKLEFSAELFRQLARKLNKVKKWVILGLVVVWIGTIMQMVGNNIS